MKRIATVILMSTLVAPAAARDLANRVTADASARSVGFGRNAIDVAERVVASDVLSRAQNLVRATEAGLVGLKMAGTPTAKEDAVQYDTAEAHLDVQKGGVIGHFYLKADPTSIDPSQRASDDALVKIAETFVRETLALPMDLDVAELTPLKIQHRIRVSATKEAPTAVERRLLASEITFGRLFMGVPVVGSGSKVRVEVGTDGTIVGYSFDWPVLRATSETQRVLAPAEIVERASKILHLGNPGLANLKRFECGYVDLGAYDSPGPVVQAGCVLQWNQGGAEGAPFEEYVPAGFSVLADRGWKATQLLLSIPASEAKAPGAGIPNRSSISN
jgi:hypothetical protein